MAGPAGSSFGKYPYCEYGEPEMIWIPGREGVIMGKQSGGNTAAGKGCNVVHGEFLQNDERFRDYALVRRR